MRLFPGTFMDQVWQTLVSVRLTIFLFGWLAFLTLVGTVLLQEDHAQKPLSQIYSPAVLKWFESLGLLDIFHSPVYVMILGLLAINVIACSIDRWPLAKARFGFDPHAPISPDDMLEKDVCWKIKTSLPLPACRERLQRYTEKNTRARMLSPNQMFFQKGAISHFGVYVTHLSLLMIFGGGIWGAIWGFEGLLQVKAGDTVSHMQFVKGSDRYFDLPHPMPRTRFPLPFDVTCTDFAIERWPDNSPKDFVSHLHIRHPIGKEERVVIRMNDPARIGDMRIYQTTYQETKDASVVLQAGGTEIAARGPLPLMVKTPYGQLTLWAVHLDFMGLGPAIEATLSRVSPSVASPKRFVLLQHHPDFRDASTPKEIITEKPLTLARLNPVYISGMQISLDPGAPYVIWGGVLMVIGMLWGLGICHHRIWVMTHSPHEIWIAGETNRWKWALERDMRLVLQRLELEVKGDHHG